MVFKAKEIQRAISIPFAIATDNNLQLENYSLYNINLPTDENQEHQHQQSVSPIPLKKISKSFSQPIIIMSSNSKKTINPNKTTNSTLSSISNIITSIAEKIPKNKRILTDTRSGLQKKTSATTTTTWSKNICTSSNSIPCHSDWSKQRKSQDEIIISPKQIRPGRGIGINTKLKDNISVTKDSPKQAEDKKRPSRNLAKSASPSPTKSLNNKNKPKKKVSSPIPFPASSMKMLKNRLISPPELIVTEAPDSSNEFLYSYPERPSSSLSSPFQHYELSKLMESFISDESEPWNNSKLFSGPRRHSCGVCVDIEKYSDCEKITPSFISDTEYDLRCTDFGISDFLSTPVDYETENENDIMTISSSDETGDSFLSASPPPRLSDPDLGSIEALAVTLSTILKMDESKKETKEPKSQIVNTNECKNFIQKRFQVSKQPNPRKPFKRQISLPVTAMSDSKKSESTHSLTKLESFNLKSKNCCSDEFGNHRLIETGRSFDSTGSRSNEDGSDDNIPNVMQDTKNPENISSLRRCFSITSSWEEGWGFGGNCSTDSLDLYWIEGEQGIPSSPKNYSNKDSEDEIFISDLERNAYFVRNNRMKQLKRQDTCGNIAPPDYCI